MINLLKKKEWDYVYSFYIVGFLTFISLITIVPIRSWMPNIIYSACYLLFLGLGCLLILQDLFCQRSILQTSLWWTVVTCGGIMVFNTFFRRVGGSLVDDIKTTMWAVELVTICYSARIRLEKNGFAKTMNLALNLVLFIHSMAALVSVIQAQLGYATKITARGVSFSQGFWRGRLWGVYMGVGYPSAVVCIALAVFFCFYCKKWHQRVFYVFCTVINYYLFLLENTRSCELALLVAVACITWIVSRKYLYKRKGKAVVKEGIAIVIAAACLISVYFINYGCRALAYYSVSNFAENDTDAENDDVVVRRDILKYDVRIEIWKAYISAYCKEMRLLGYNKSGYEQYLKDRYPEELGRVKEMGWGTHSGYIDALCRVGWVGMLLFVAWIMYHIWRSLRYIIKRIDVSPEKMCSLAIIIIMMVDCVFEETAFWTFTFSEVMIFWLLAGNLTFEVGKQEYKQK